MLATKIGNGAAAREGSRPLFPSKTGGKRWK
nr:MAG TPA: hypothetical protein [Caudoviricetes sp.]